MDIKQSHLSNYRVDKPKLTNSPPASSQSAKSPELREGQPMKESAVDLRYNEIKFLLEQSELTALKALTASNLPITENNKALVAELLNHRMPIDKQTLQTLVKVSLINRDASPQTLVLMYKNNIPMSTSNMKQFEAYQNGTHQLLDNMKDITNHITDLLKPEAPFINTPVSFDTALQTNRALIDILYPTTENSTSNSPLQSSPIQSWLTPEELALFSKAVNQKNLDLPSLPAGITPDILKQISDGTLSLKETVKLITTFFSEQPEAVPAQLSHVAVDPTQAGPNATAVINKILEQNFQLPDTSAKLSELIDSSFRDKLITYLPDVPEHQNLIDKISLGTASLKETLTFIQEQLPSIDKATVGKLLQAPEYSKLLEEAFLQKWTLTPDMAADKAKVSELYHQLKEDIDKLSHLATSGKEAEEFTRVKEPVKSMQENLQFMKDLNDVFTYLQLPIQFKNQNAHTDLYVLTRKKALNDNRENLSVLLHLTMTNLGSLNIHLQMYGKNQIQAAFYLEEKEVSSLLRDNLPSLTQALQNKGYSLQAEVKDTYKKPDFIQDFIEQNSHSDNIQRYSFDIRT